MHEIFPEGGCFLPDSTAIELLSNHCHFRPKEITVEHRFSTLLQSVKQVTNDLSFFTEFFKDVESLILTDSTEDSKDHTTDASMTALRLVLANSAPRLTSLSLNLFKTADTLTPSIASALTSSYNTLKELHITTEFSPDMEKLISITKFHPKLQTISISRRSGHILFDQRENAQMPKDLFVEWIQICFKKPSFSHLRLNLRPEFTIAVLQQVLIAFFSAPCLRDQTLTFSNVPLGYE